MVKKLYSALFIAAVSLIIISIYTGIGKSFSSMFLQWGEVVIVFSLLAGLFKLIRREVVRTYKEKENAFYSLTIIISCAVTFIAGLLNFESNKAVMNNTIKERPEYLVEIVRILIDEDSYLKKYPAKEKLVLIVAGKASTLFTPTEEMLKKADFSIDDYNSFRFDKKNLMPNEDDDFQVEILIEKIRKISLETVRTMLPAAIEMKAWFNHSVSSLPDSVITADLVRESGISDIVLGDSKVEGSGVMLKRLIAEYIEKRNLSKIEKSEILVNYKDLVIDSEIGIVISSQYSSQLDSSLSPEVSGMISTAYLKTEVTSSHKIKGVMQWIYRRIYAPLLSAFMSLLLFSMIAAAYRRFSFRSYSMALITLSSFAAIAGFIYAPVKLNGPFFSQDFLMNVFSESVFRALTIGAAIGVLFFYFNAAVKIFLPEREKE